MSSSDSHSEIVIELAEEFLDRYRKGERPPLAEYTSRHPDLADEILEVFPAMAMMENIAIDEQAVTEEREEAPALKQLGDYRIIREAGRGGMGVVYEAEQVSLGRHVALKVLPASMLPDSKHARRFEREAKSAAKLHHTNIVPVFGVGEQDGLHYYVMQFIQGLPLDEVIAELRKVQARPTGEITSSFALGKESGDRSVADVARSLMTGQFPQTDVVESEEKEHEVAYGVTELNPLEGDDSSSMASESTNLSGSFCGSISGSISLPGQSGVHSSSHSKKFTYWESVANIGLEVADALHYAHEQGILHRDIKPGNLLLDLKGTTWITDFGLAKATDQQDITHTGDILGTLRYMPPEAFEGNTDGRSDIYSLGLTLFELLAFQPAFGERDRHQLIKQVTTEAAPQLDKINPAIPRDLVTIVHKAIERDPGHRYQTAEDMQADLQRFLYDEPIKARRISLVERFTRWSRRNKGLAVSLATVCLLLLVINIAGPILTLKLVGLNRELTQTAEDLEDSRTDAEKKASENLKLAQVAAASAGKAERARRESVTMLADMQTERGILAGETDPATAALWFASAAQLTPHDPDRQAANHLRARNWLNQAMIPVASLEVPDGSLPRMAFQPHGDLLMTWNTAGLRIFLWQLEQPLPWTESLSNIADACWSPDGTQVAVASRTGEVKLYQVPSGTLRATITQTAPLYAVQWSPKGQSLAVGGERVQVWNVISEPRLQHNWPHLSPVYALRFNQAGDRLVTACLDSQARLFSVTDDSTLSAPLFDPIQHLRTSTMAAPVFCDSDQRLVTCSSTGVQHWDVKTGEELTPENLIHNDVSNYALTASSDGKWTSAAKTSDRYCCVLWNSSGDNSLLQHDNVVMQSIFSPDGQTILTLGWDQMATLWKLPTSGTPSFKVNRFDSPFATGAFSNDSQFVAIGGSNHVVVWQLPPSNVLLGRVDSWDLGRVSRGTQRLGQLPPPRPRLSFDGQLATLGIWHEGLNPRTRNNVLQVVRTSDGQPAGPIIHCAGNMIDSCICTDNRSVAGVSYGSGKGTLSVYQISTGQEIWPAITLPSPPLCLEARPNESHLAVLCREGQLLVLQSETGKVVHEISHENWRIGSNSHIARVTYSPEGSSLVTLSPTNQLIVRDASTGQLRFPVLNPISHGGPCRAIAFSPDSRLIATAVNDEDTLQVWDLTTGQSVSPAMPHPTAFYGIFSVEFSPDGRWILTAHTDRRLRLWDWKTGTLVIPPMQNTNELYDARFTPDGRYALAAVRHGGINIWDLKSGKPAAPELKYPPQWNYSLHPSTYILGMNGLRVVAGGDGFFPIVDLAPLIQEPQFSLDSLQSKAQLAASSTLQLGELTRYQDSEWQEMWADYRKSNLTLQSLAHELDEIRDSSLRRMLAKQAASLNLLEQLADLRPEVIELKEILAQESARQGDRASAIECFDEVIRLYEHESTKNSEDEGIAHSLAELLFARQDLRWDILKPTEMETDAGTTLSLQEDGSILASQEPGSNESYLVTAQPRPGKIAAIRLEALTHPGLPGLGPGWGGSNFHLTEFSAVLKREEQDSAELQFRLPMASHTRTLAEGGRSGDGSQAVIDNNQETLWDIWPHPGKPHWLILPLNEPIEISNDDEFVIRLDFLDKRWPLAKLGCFRLSVTDEMSLDKYRQQRQTMDRLARGELKGFEALGTFYSLQGDTERGVQSFLTALKFASSYSAEQQIFEAATNFEQVLARLRESFPEHPALLSLELQHLTEHEAPARNELYQRTVSALEQQLNDRPDPTLAGQLAQLLLEDQDVNWTLMTPTDLRSRSGTTFEVLNDQSVLAGGENPDSETYMVELKPELPHITALRLETMPDPSLPKGGSGRDANGSFWLNEFVVYAYEEPSSRVAPPALQLRSAIASVERDSQRSIDRAIDGSTGTWWDAWPEIRTPQWAVFPTPGLKEMDGPVRLIVRLEFRGPTGSQPTIGRFRLSCTNRDDGIARLLAARTSNPWVQLIVAYQLKDRENAMTTLIDQHPEFHAELAEYYSNLQDWDHALPLYNGLISTDTKDPMLLANRAEANFESGNRELAEADWKRAFELDPKSLTLPRQIVLELEQDERWMTVARYSSATLDRYPESRLPSSSRSRFLLSMIRRKNSLFETLRELRPKDTLLPVCLARDFVQQNDWKNAVKHYAIVENDPLSEEWYEYAGALLLAGETEKYRSLISRIIDQVGAIEDPFMAYWLARAVSLTPETVADRQQAVQWGELCVNETEDAWRTHVAGLAHLRAGHYEQALKRLEQSAQSDWEPQLNHLALALLYGKQENLTKSREYFELAEIWFAEQEAPQRSPNYFVPSTDWLEATLLREEIRQILSPKSEESPIKSPRPAP